MQVITVGRFVHYVLTEDDAKAVNRRRTDGASIAARIKQKAIDVDGGFQSAWPLGAQAHIGNHASEGDIVPLLVVRVWANEYGDGVPGVNGQAFLDGNDVLWITSAREGTEPGTWQWPART